MRACGPLHSPVLPFPEVPSCVCLAYPPLTPFLPRLSRGVAQKSPPPPTDHTANRPSPPPLQLAPARHLSNTTPRGGTHNELLGCHASTLQRCETPRLPFADSSIQRRLLHNNWLTAVCSFALVARPDNPTPAWGGAHWGNGARIHKLGEMRGARNRKEEKVSARSVCSLLRADSMLCKKQTRVALDSGPWGGRQAGGAQRVPSGRHLPRLDAMPAARKPQQQATHQ